MKPAALLSLIRLRTLPLAFAVIAAGNALAADAGSWQLSTFLLSLACALSLQVLSNIANDYGDGIRGTDRLRAKTSPARLTAAGTVSPQAVKCTLAGSIIITAFIGGWLIIESAAAYAALFWLLGGLSILAAIFYTVGRHAYGYYGLGEAAVFLFFGLLGVLGSCALQTGRVPPAAVLPAAGLGFLCAAVLHVNNLRDIETDPLSGKNTIAVRLGFNRAKTLHAALWFAAGICLALYAPAAGRWASLLWLILAPVIVNHIKTVQRAENPQQAGKSLKTAVLLTLAVSLLFSAGTLAGA